MMELPAKTEQIKKMIAQKIGKKDCCIFSNQRSRCLFNFEALTWLLVEGRRLFQSKNIHMKSQNFIVFFFQITKSSYHCDM